MRALQGRYFRLRAVRIFTARKRKFLHRYTITETKSLHKTQYISGNFCIHIQNHQCAFNEKYYFLFLTNGLFSNNSRDFRWRAVNSPIACKQKYQNGQKLQNSNTSESFKMNWNELKIKYHAKTSILGCVFFGTPGNITNLI